MKHYIGTKTIQAEPMSLMDAAKLLNRKITPANPEETEGYLVEYEDGYRSWSPASAFKKAYKLAETYNDRLLIERSQLCERIEKLSAFINTEKFGELGGDERKLLCDQLNIMYSYRHTLDERINLPNSL